MDATRQISVTLPAELADQIDARVAAGEYANASEVVSEGLMALAGHDQALEYWLRTEAVRAYDEWKADPSSAIPLEDVRAHFEQLRLQRSDSKE